MGDVTQVLAGIPSDSNPFTYLRNALAQQVLPKTSGWLDIATDISSALLALTTLSLLIGFFMRWRNKALWFIKVTELPSGRLYCPHSVNCFNLFSLIFTIIAQATVWLTARGIDRGYSGELTAWLPPLVWQLYFLPLFLTGWSDMSGVICGIITSHFRRHRSVPRWLNIHLVHAWIYVVPVLGCTGLGILFAFFSQRINALVLALNTLDNQLQVYQAAWTSGPPSISELLSLQPYLTASQTAQDQFFSLDKILFSFVVCWSLLLWAVWVPANVVQAVMLYRQIHHLNQTVRHEKRSSSDEKRASDEAASPATPALQSSLRQRSSSRARSHSRTRSSVERQARSLMNMCWMRIGSILLTSITITYFTFLAFQLVIRPQSVTTTRWEADMLLTGVPLGFSIVGLFIAVLFALRSFDATTNGVVMHGEEKEVGMAPMTPKTGGTRHHLSLTTSQSMTGSRGTRALPRSPLVVQVDVESMTRIDVDDTLSLEGLSRKKTIFAPEPSPSELPSQ